MRGLLIVLFSSFGVAGIMTLSCTFNRGYNITGVDNDTMTMTYKHDDVSRKTYTEGNNGISEARMIPTGEEGLLHFVELTGLGNLMVMSVDLNKNGINAMYSRHVKIITSILPSQRYGHCDFSYKKSPEVKVESSVPTKDDLVILVEKLNLLKRMKDLPTADKELIQDTLQGRFTPPKKDTKMETVIILSEIADELMKISNKGNK